MATQLIQTKHGDILLKDLSDELLRVLQNRLTYGFYPYEKDFNGYRYGFVVNCGTEEIYCIKQQPVEMPKDTAYSLVSLHMCQILETYCQLKDTGQDMVYYATPYIKEKNNGEYESGIAHFIFPGTDSPNTAHFAYDGAMGVGATGCFMAFMEIFKNITKNDVKIPYIGLDLRTCSQLGGFISGFMLYKDIFIYHGIQISENDFRFNLLAKHGVKEVVYAPSMPMSITPEQLNEAKGLK